MVEIFSHQIPAHLRANLAKYDFSSGFYVHRQLTDCQRDLEIMTDNISPLICKRQLGFDSDVTLHFSTAKGVPRETRLWLSTDNDGGKDQYVC